MSTSVGYATLQIIPSARGFQGALQGETDPASRKAGQRGGGLMGAGLLAGAKKAIAPLAALAGAAAIGGFFKDAVNEASDLNEATTALQAVFGKSAADVQKFAGNSAKDFGQTRLAALNAAQTFGVYGKAAGLSAQANEQFSTKLVGLSSDLASFYNTSPEEAIAAIGSGLRGEAEPLRKYGVLLDSASLSQEAMRQGLIKNTKQALTPQQKVLAAQALIMKQTSVAQGDFQRTSGGLANQQRILSAQFTNLKGTVGKAFLPVIVKAVTGLNGLFSVVGKVGGALKAGFTGQAGGLFGVLGIVGKIGGAFRVVYDTARTFFAAFTGGGQKGSAALTPLAQRAVAFGLAARAAFDAVLSAVRRLWPQIQAGAAVVLPMLQRAAGVIAPALRTLAATFTGTVLPAIFAVVGWIRANLVPVFTTVVRIIATQVIPIFLTIARFIVGTVYPAVLRIVVAVGQRLKPVFDALVRALQTSVLPSLQKILAKFREWWPTIQKVISIVISVTGFILKLAAAILGKVLPPLIRFVAFLLKNVVSAIVGVIGFVVKIISKLISFGSEVGKAGAAVGRFASAVVKGFAAGIKYVESIPGKVKGAFKSAGALLSGIGGDIVQGLVNGISGAAHKVLDAAMGLVDKIPAPIRKAMGIRSPSRVMIAIGRYITQGLVIGLTGSASQIKTATNTLVAKLQDGLTSYKSAKSSLTKRISSDASAVKTASSRYQAALHQHGKGASAAIKSAREALSKARGKLSDDKKASTALTKSYGGLTSSKTVTKLVSKALATEKRLTTLTTARAAVTAKLTAAQKTLSDLQTKASDYAANVRDAVTATGNVTGFGDENGVQSFKGIVAGMKAAITQAQKFSAAIATLKKSGLNSTTLDQIVQAGPQQGLATANAILAAGTAGVTQVNGLNAQLTAAASSTAKTASDAMYAAGIHAAQGLVDGLSSQEKALTKQMDKLADALVAQVKKSLKIHSPSRVFHELGGYTAEGMALGIESGTGRVTKAARAMVAIPEKTDSQGRPIAAASRSTTVTVPLHLDKRVLTEAVFEVGGREYGYGRNGG